MIANAVLSLLLAVTPTTLPELTSPLTITSVEWYRDGGTTSVVIVDAKGVTVMGGFGVDMATEEHPIFLNARHFRAEGAVILAADSEAAVAFVSLVQRALAESLGPDELARWREASREEDVPGDHRIRNQWLLRGLHLLNRASSYPGWKLREHEPSFRQAREGNSPSSKMGSSRRSPACM